MTRIRVNEGRTTSGGRAEAAPDRGASSLEFAVWMLGWVLMLSLLAFAYQLQSSSDDVADAAGEAARAASLTAARTDAARTARSTAMDRLTKGACRPNSIAVAVDLRDYRAGGSVRVTVSCRTKPPIGPGRTLISTGEEVIDRYRGGI